MLQLKLNVQVHESNLVFCAFSIIRLDGLLHGLMICARVQFEVVFGFCKEINKFFFFNLDLFCFTLDGFVILFERI
jgi:hypothetical protein